MITLSQLQTRVESRFELLGLPTWPDPHPGVTSPPEQEYSRVTDPGRYRIVHERARAWAAVLEGELGVRREVLQPPRDGGEGAFDRGVRLVPDRADALPLLLLEREVPARPGDVPLAVVDIAVARPEIVVATEPDCGCDACDSGSRELLDAVDEAVRHVVGGPFVVLRGRHWHAEWHPESWSGGSTRRSPNFDRVIDACRRLADGETVRLPRHTEALVGQSWLR